MSYKFLQLIVVALSLFAGAASARGESEASLPQQVKGLLEANCFRCHGEYGSGEGGVDYILDRQKLVERGKVTPGKPDDSRLLARIVAGEMPADDDPLPENEVALIRQWIEIGAPDFDAPAAAPAGISTSQMLAAIRADLESFSPRDRRFTRYLTLTHLYNLDTPAEQMELYRQAVSKLVNSLSREHRIAAPQPIDEHKTVLRIDLRDYGWTADLWDRMQNEDPYAISYNSPDALFIRQACGGKQPALLRADWFAAAASTPPLYHEILGIPATKQALQRQLGVDAAANIEGERVMRAGFNGSGVSQNNRLIERHDSPDGAYWESYDFSGNSDSGSERKNLFAHPLGPGGENGFSHDGGEIIFSLPNGLQGYMLTDAEGNRIDKGPVEIVSDPSRPDRAVINGLSCMSCHAGGIIPKDDQVRESAVSNRGLFSEDEFRKILALYPPKEKLQARMKADSQRFLNALKQAGVSVGKQEPVSALAQQFEREVDLEQAAEETGMEKESFLANLLNSRELARSLAPLRTAGGTVKREVFADSFRRLIDEFRLRNDTIANSIDMQLVFVPGGEFLMGSAADDEDAEADERPRRRVHIAEGFYMAAHETTVGQFRRFVEETGFAPRGGYGYDAARRKFLQGGRFDWENPGFRQTDEHPVVNVSWDDAQAFCEWLSKKEGVAYRLPTEAEWELACRGGAKTRFWTGQSADSLQGAANIAESALQAVLGVRFGPGWDDAFEFTAPAGAFRSNPLGLFDMHGNVWEWCEDRYSPTSYKTSPTDDPRGPASGSRQVVRGGSWASTPGQARAADRSGYPPTERNLLIGFRVVRELE